MHFACLAKDEESAQDSHVLACNFVKHLPIKKIIDTLGNKHYLLLNQYH